MEENNSDTVDAPFRILVEGEFTTIAWLDHNIVQDLLSHTKYQDFKQNIHMAVEHGFITSPDIAKHITAIFGLQEGYELGAKLKDQKLTSLTLLRWLLIAYGSASTRKWFLDDVVQVLKEANKLMREGPEQHIYIQSDTLYMRQVGMKKHLELLQRYTGILKYFLGVTGEQLILNQRWGLPKQWVPDQVGIYGQWNKTWAAGTMEELARDLWNAKSNIELKLVEAGQTTGYTLQYSDMSWGEDRDDGEARRVLKFWPQNGKAALVYPTEVPATGKELVEQVRASIDLFDAILERKRVATSQDTASNLLSNRYATGEDTIPQLKLNGVLIGPDTPPPILPSQLAADQTGQDTAPQLQPPKFDITQNAAPQTKSGEFLTVQITEPHALPGQFSTDQTGEYISRQVQLDRSAAGNDTAPQPEPNISAIVQNITHQMQPDRFTTAQDNAPQAKTNMFVSDIANTMALSENSPLSDGTSINIADSDLFANTETAPPTAPLPSLPLGKADENELSAKVELSAEERSDLIISNYAEALLAKNKKKQKEAYPVQDCDSDVEGERPPCRCELRSLCKEPHEKLEAGDDLVHGDRNTIPSANGDTIDGEVATQETNSGRVTRNNRPCLRIDIADVEERLAVLDAAELVAMEERNGQGNRSLAEQDTLGLPERERQLEEELRHSIDIKEELLGKLESNTPLVSKIKAVEKFFDEVGEEAKKLQGWTEELRTAEAAIDHGYDGDWEGETETPSEGAYANEQTTLEMNTEIPSSQAEVHAQSSRASTSLQPEGNLEDEPKTAQLGLQAETEKVHTENMIQHTASHAVEQVSLENGSIRSVAGSDESDYTRTGPRSPIDDKIAKEIYTAEEYEIPSPPVGN